VFFEDAGVPTATVISTEFVNAARTHARALSADDYRTVVVAHPIQPLTGCGKTHGRAGPARRATGCPDEISGREVAKPSPDIA
jgi:hypothetical protein